MPADVEQRRIEFLKLLRQAPEVTDIAQLDASGREQIAVSRLGMDVVASGKDRSAEPAFVNARRGKPWYGPVYFRKETEPYMTVAIRSGGDKGPLTVAEVNLKFIWDVVSRIKIGDKGKAYVVDAQRPAGGRPRHRPRAAQDQPGRAGAREGRCGGARPDEPAMLSHDLAGTQVLASMAPIEPLDWKVFVEQPVSEVYARLNASILWTVRAAAGRPGRVGAGGIGAGAQHGAPDPHARRRRAPHRRGRPRAADRRQDRRRTRRPGRSVQPHERRSCASRTPGSSARSSSARPS